MPSYPLSIASDGVDASIERPSDISDAPSQSAVVRSSPNPASSIATFTNWPMRRSAGSLIASSANEREDTGAGGGIRLAEAMLSQQGQSSVSTFLQGKKSLHFAHKASPQDRRDAKIALLEKIWESSTSLPMKQQCLRAWSELQQISLGRPAPSKSEVDHDGAGGRLLGQLSSSSRSEYRGAPESLHDPAEYQVAVNDFLALKQVLEKQAQSGIKDAPGTLTKSDAESLLIALRDCLYEHKKAGRISNDDDLERLLPVSLFKLPTEILSKIVYAFMRDADESAGMSLSRDDINKIISAYFHDFQGDISEEQSRMPLVINALAPLMATNKKMRDIVLSVLSPMMDQEMSRRTLKGASGKAFFTDKALDAVVVQHRHLMTPDYSESSRKQYRILSYFTTVQKEKLSAVKSLQLNLGISRQDPDYYIEYSSTYGTKRASRRLLEAATHLAKQGLGDLDFSIKIDAGMQTGYYLKDIASIAGLPNSPLRKLVLRGAEVIDGVQSLADKLPAKMHTVDMGRHRMDGTFLLAAACRPGNELRVLSMQYASFVTPLVLASTLTSEHNQLQKLAVRLSLESVRDNDYAIFTDSLLHKNCKLDELMLLAPSPAFVTPSLDSGLERVIGSRNNKIKKLTIKRIGGSNTFQTVTSIANGLRKPSSRIEKLALSGFSREEIKFLLEALVEPGFGFGDIKVAENERTKKSTRIIRRLPVAPLQKGDQRRNLLMAVLDW